MHYKKRYSMRVLSRLIQISNLFKQNNLKTKNQQLYHASKMFYYLGCIRVCFNVVKFEIVIKWNQKLNIIT